MGQAVPAEPPLIPQPVVAPQWFMSAPGSTHVPLQSIIGGGQAVTHAPFEHDEPVGHACPAEPTPPTPQPGEAPQYADEPLGSTQLPPQRTMLPVHAQLPPKQTSPVPQAVPALPS
jgi:hypothetical protein